MNIFNTVCAETVSETACMSLKSDSAIAIAGLFVIILVILVSILLMNRD